ncbi:PREDICTED: thyroid adenoma-associated protein [Nanorana parkeri]|uniref:thyroid adenoma-associated protein n=1 Tax=Nanorana parkeri TaxID=125878 RepID=UPI000854F4F0|nr:PREDICTED: thyroid adenoma-associated protein [Nanorana parkeri]
MVLKKKKEIKVDVLTLDGASLENLKNFTDGEAEGLPSLLLQCLQLQDGVQQIHCIKKVMPLLENLPSSSAGTKELCCSMSVLAEMYFAVDNKNPLKKVLASALNSIPDACKSDVICAFTSCLKKDIAVEDTKGFRKVVDNMASCMENSIGHECFSCLFFTALQFLFKVLHSFQSQNKKVLGDGLAQTQLMHDLLTSVKLAMVLLQKSPEAVQELHGSDAQSLLWKEMCDLLCCFTNILLDDDLLQNVHSTSGMAVILYLKTMVRNSEKLSKLVNDLILLSVDSSDAPNWFIYCCGALCKDPPDTVLLFLCQGALAMLEWRDDLGPGGEMLLLNLLRVLLSLSSRLRESSTALYLSRILALWTTSALGSFHSCSKDLQDCFNGSSSTMCSLLEYVYINWEHPLDAVRHQTKQIFRNILQIHHTAMMVIPSREVDPFLCQLTHKLLSLEWHSKGKYASLACLVECVGTEQILSVDHMIPEQILDVMWDQSFAPYAANLLEAMFVNHKKQLLASKQSCWIERWHSVWVSPLLRRLCEEDVTRTTYIIDYYLPKLLKCNPESLTFMIVHLQSSAAISVGSGSNRGALGALMACLRTARAHGHLRFTENYAWNGRVSTGLIKQGLVHRHDQIRMDALGLLCESHWSTEVVSVDEMNLVRFFLKYNLNCQSPSVRQQMCYLIKKLFCRVQESSQVLYKHQQSKNFKVSQHAENEVDPCTALRHYAEFMSSITGYLFESLFPGSSHPTRFSALTILGSIAETFPDVQGSCQNVFQFARSVSGNNVHALLECFSNTFEEVKLLAFELLRKLPPSVLGLQDPEKLLELFQAVMILSTSTKHFGCVTASYLLKFLVYQEGLEAALRDWAQSERNVPDYQTFHIDSTSFLERNTFTVARLLMDNLEQEIVLAQSSLLEAAASFPLYGRVHCVIGALEQLPVGSLLAVEEWRNLVSRLITMSYRLSAIVSPVVHSSSPEGLMPMDTESEAAAQLHMIMSEIKPRDTNDYFTQPRILQKDYDLHSQALPEDRVPSNTLCAEMKGNEGASCNVTAQMVLVCCWRSMKEVSLLLGFLCQNLPLQTQLDSPRGLITVEQVKEMGEYFKHHLLQSRHRGAFELAYVGFVKLTDMLIGCKEESLRSLPRQWLCNVLEEIKSSDPSSRLCATRRSAGIPFYIQALLASEPKNSKACLLKMTMKELINLAMPSSDLSGNNSTIPQVHALNILRAIFRDTRLGENVIPYVGEGTQAAILGFTSPVWAVRNSSTLLFSTLITRIFGVKRGKDERSKKNRMTGREFFSRFPVLYPFLLEKLEAVANTVDSPTGESKLHPSLYLLLLILSKLYPSPMDGTYSALSMAPFIPFIMRCANSPVYRSREMAARALVPFLLADDIPCTTVELIRSLPDSVSHLVRQNHIHGVLLQVLYLLQSFFEAKHTTNSEKIQQEVCDITDSLKAKLWLAKRQNPCLVTRAAFIDILTTISNYLGKAGNQGTQRNKRGSSFWDDVHSVIKECELLEGSQYTASVPGLVLYMQSTSRLILSMLNWIGSPGIGWRDSAGVLNPSSLVQMMLVSELYEVRLLALEFVLRCKKTSHGGATDSLLCPAIEKTLFEMVTKENNLECLCQVMRILYEMNVENVLLMAKQNFQMEPKDLLRRIINLVSAKSHSVEIQSSSLKLSSRLVISLAGKDQEATESEMKDWVTLMVHCCGDELQTEVKLAAAEILVYIAPHLLTSQLPLLGVSDTLQLWMCVVQLLQSEDPDVRDVIVDIIRVYHAQKNKLSGTGFAFSTVNPPMALDLTLGVLCELLQQWDEVSAGVPVLLEWLLGEDDLSDLETANAVEDDYLFEKGEANFWAEKLVYIRLLAKHLGELMDRARCSTLPDPKLLHISQAANERSESVQSLFNDFPPTPQFLKTSEYNKLLIHKERTSRCMDILNVMQTRRGS